MNVLFPAVAAPSSFQLGVRAVIRGSEKRLIHGATSATSATRAFTTASRIPHTFQSCTGYRIQGTPSPSRILRDRRSQSALLPRTSVRTIFRFRSITHYSELPPDYEDAKGLEFRKEDLTQREVDNIFGAGRLKAGNANDLLRIIQGRRVAGTLDDPGLQPNTAQYSTDDKIKAITYLRKHIPVDEVVNAGLRAEDELSLLEEQGLQETQEQPLEETEEQAPRPKKMDQNKSAKTETEIPEDTAPAKPTGRLPLPKKPDSPYGESMFDRIRAKNLARQAEEEKKLEEERLKREAEESIGVTGVPANQEAPLPRQLSPAMEKWTQRATSDLTEPPEMSAWQRLAPSLVVGAVLLGACVLFASIYVPPRRDWRLWPDVPPAAATCLGLILANVVVWALWKTPPFWGLLNRYFLVVAATPRPLSLVGAMFSQQSAWHMIVNMVTLWFFGVRLHDEIGRGNFLAIYFGSGILGYMATLSDLVLRRGLQYTSLGASGAAYGVVIAYFWLHRYDEFKILGFPPDPVSGPQGLGFIGLIVGLHLLASFSKRAHNVDTTSHWGGMLAGLVGANLVQRRMQEAARLRAERMKTMGVLEKALDNRPAPAAAASSSSSPLTGGMAKLVERKRSGRD